MKNNKGFTLIEILGAIIIIGIISIIAFNTFTSSLRGFREDYYTEISRTLEKSGQEFFNDNRNYRPGQILGAQKVSISTLASKSYVNEVVDYNGDKCENTSYVLIVKEARDEYSYHTCLVCSEDSYDNTEDEYCDPAWLDLTKISYGIGDVPTVYVYKGTPRDEVKDKLELSISYQRLNSKGEVIKSVRGTGEDKLPTILPVDMDVVDTNKIGTYKVHYEYKPVTNGKASEEVERKEGKLIVYENEAPNLNITYRDVVAKQGATLANVRNNVTEEKTGNYVSGEWHQEITIKLSQPTIVEPDVTASRYQWKKADGRWVDFCTTNSSCSVTISSDMNETVEFRMIDTNGKISKLTNPIIIRRDKTKPTCKIQDYGTKGDDDWYRSDVNIRFTVNEDVNSTYAGAISGVKLNNLDMSIETINRSQHRDTNVHKTDTTGVTYIGYVEDRANNYNTCEVTFKRDVTPPVCELQTAGTTGLNNWFVSNVTVSFKTATDATSNVRRYGLNNDSGVHSTTHTNDTASVTYTGYIRDKAGNTNNCSITFKKDATKPTCSMKISGTVGLNSWYTSNVAVEFATTGDNLSGVYQYGIGGYTNSRTYNHTADTASVTYTGYIKDNAGNTNTCVTQTFKKDGTKPTCTMKDSGTKGDNNWYTSNVAVEFATTGDNLSGVYQYGIGAYTNDRTATHTTDTVSVTYTGYIKDNAGNTNTCATAFKKDGTKPVCGNLSGESTSWTAEDRTVSVGCSDATSLCVQNSYSTTISSGTTSTKSISFTLKDNAGNTQSCSKTANVYVDKENPVCGDWSGESTEWTAENRTVSVGCSDTGSGCVGTYTNTTSSGTVSTKAISFTIKDAVGNTNTCSKTANVYVDKEKPTCGDWSGESTEWTKGNRTVKVGCSDSGSGCTQTSYSDTTSSGTVKTKDISLTIKDAVGNTNSCSKTANVYVDKEKPTCGDWSGESTEWTKGNRTVKVGCSDSGSGCEHSTYSDTTNSGTVKTKSISFTISDKVGNTRICSKKADVYVDKDAPTCGDWSGESTEWTAGNRTVKVGCSDSGGSGCEHSTYSDTTNSGTVKTKNISLTIKDGVGHTNTCSKTANVYVDKDKPTCTTSKVESTQGKTSGVTVKMSCSDSGGSGCTTASDKVTGATSNVTFNVTDGVGHSNTCSETITSQLQRRSKSCNEGKRCSSAGCEERHSCESSSCGCKSYHWSCAQGSCGQDANSYSSCSTNSSCVRKCSSYKSCENSSCSCKTYKRSKSECGCDSWGSYGDWSNASSCSEGATSNNSTYYDCRTIYS